MIEVSSVSLRYSGCDENTLTDLSLSFESSGMTVILGRSGVGKSTLISLIAGMLVQSDSVVEKCLGRISVNGGTPSQLRGPRNVSWVPQSPLLLDHLSVLENILLPATVDDTHDAAKLEARAVELMGKAGLEGKGHCHPRELSGGMMTRVSLLRALITSPKVLFMDEPFSGLDLVTRFDIYRLIQWERSGEGMTTIITTHDIPEAALLADRVIFIKEDDELGTWAEVFPNSPACLDDWAGALASARASAIRFERRLFTGEPV